jgi:glycosyltransferase involved in cell wall biosynthesis
MGEHVRSSWRAFVAAGGAPKIYDIFKSNKLEDPDFEREFGPAITDRISSRVNVFHMNADEAPQALPYVVNDPRFAQAYNIIYPAWELSKYPSAWAAHIERFDEVWAPSEFIRAAIAESTRTPVVHMPLAVDVRMSSFVTRRMLGLPEHAFIFLFFFDYSSYMARKNPFAVLDAFAKLVERYPDAPLHLVMKHKAFATTSGEVSEQFKAALARNPGQIQVIDRMLSDNEIKNLVRASDCFVSLHRSEGFGRGLAEAMALGVPAIGTGYSGNLDFMDADNSWLVDYRLVGVGESEYPYAAGQVWADASVESAVACMESVAFDRAAARMRAERARRDMRGRFSPRAIGLRYMERLSGLGRQVNVR